MTEFIEIFKAKGLIKAVQYLHLVAYLFTLLFIIEYGIMFLPRIFEKISPFEVFDMHEFFIKSSVFMAESLLMTIWFMCFLVSTRRRLYKWKTGRDLKKDCNDFKRTPKELFEFYSSSEPHKLDLGDKEKFPEASWNEMEGIVFGKFEKQIIGIPGDCESNIAIFGPPGSRKTTGLANTNAITFDGSVLATDIKGDIYNFVSKHSTRRILRFCPDHPKALSISCGFDPFYNFEKMNETDKRLYIESMASILIKVEGDGADNYFSSRARKLFCGITYLLLDKNPWVSFPDLVETILVGNVFSFVKEAIASDCTIAKEYLASFYGNNEKNVSGAYDALSTALVHFSNPILKRLLCRTGRNNTQTLRKTITIADLENGFDIYLQISQEHLDAYAPLFTLIIQSFSTAFTKRPDTSSGRKNRPILMLLDEFPQLTFSQELISSNLATLRSKSIVIMLIQQNYAQLERKYNPEGARAILGNCHYQLILGSNDINSSKMFSEMIGDKRVLRKTSSQTEGINGTTSMSSQECLERVYPPEYFGDLDNTLILYFKGKYAEIEKLNCFKN